MPFHVSKLKKRGKLDERLFDFASAGVQAWPFATLWLCDKKGPFKMCGMVTEAG